MLCLTLLLIVVLALTSSFFGPFSYYDFGFDVDDVVCLLSLISFIFILTLIADVNFDFGC